MSWLADASANKIVKSYIQDFVDISGNFKVRNAVAGTVVDNGPVAWNQLGADIDGEFVGDNFGNSVSLSDDGTIVAIGARFNDDNGSRAGHVRVYEYSGGSWSQLGADIDGEAAGDRLGNTVSLSSDGTRLASGGLYNDANGNAAGHVRVYEYSGGSWSQLGGDIDGEATLDESGEGVSLSSDGTIVAIGAKYNDGNGSNSGHVRVYEYSGGSWSQLGADIDGEALDDNSGYSVSLSSDGTIVAIGARYNDGNGSDSGHVRIYEYSGGSWNQLGADIDGEAAGDSFGWRVALSSDGTILAIGAIYNDGNGSDSGHVRVYEYSGGSWSQLGADIDGEAAADESGFSVSLSSDGTILAIGACYNDGNGADAGHARVYEYSGGSWSQVGGDIDGEAAGDWLGYSVSLSSDGTIVAIGARYNDENGADAGHARIYNKTGGVVTTPGSEIVPMDVSGGIVSFFQAETDSTVDNGPVAWSQLGSDINGEAADDRSGWRLSLSSDGTIVAIGAVNNDGNGAESGHVRIYGYTGSSWTQLGSDINGEAAGDQLGFDVSLSSDGTILATGAWANDGGGANSGHVRIYEYNGSSWTQLGADIDGEGAGDVFGGSVTISSDGTIVAIGGTKNDEGGTDSGHVRIYGYNGSSWSQLGADIDGSGAGESFGKAASLSSDGTIVAIGAQGADGLKSGLVRVYEYNGSSWSQLGVDIDSEGEADRFGGPLSLSSDGTILAAGGSTNDGNGADSGHVRIYKYSGGSWTQLGSDIDGEAAGDRLGSSVSLSSDGTIVAIGAIYNDGNGANSGHARIYEYDGSSWNQLGADIDGEAAGDFSGWSISLSSDGTIVAIGATLNDGNGTDAGHVRVYNKTGGTVTTYTSIETMKIEDGTVDINGTTWINQGQSGASIATSNQGAFIIESAGTSSSNSVVYVETTGQTQAFSIRENGDLYSANALQHSSDDRRKTNEQYITNATETIQKLSPQIYTKLNDLVQNGGTGTKTESGLIAQEIYYNAPELRHLVHIEDEYGNKLTPQEYDLSGNDIQNDPDYTALGWGNKSAMVDYTGIIPYLIKSNQEQDACIQERQELINEQQTLIEDFQTRIASLESK